MVKVESSINIKSAIKSFQNGQMLIVVDDEDRENEGDFIIAAEKAVKPVFRSKVSLMYGARMIIPKKPMTTLGIAAKNSTITFKNSRNFCGNNSPMKIAAQMPKGTAITDAVSVTAKLPASKTQTP